MSIFKIFGFSQTRRNKTPFFHRITTQANTPLSKEKPMVLLAILVTAMSCHSCGGRFSIAVSYFIYCIIKENVWTLNSEHLPMTVKFIFKFRVGELRKSTRHRYIPSSDSLILSTFNCAGRFAVLKKARDPNTVGDDHSFACPIGRPRTSKLQIQNYNRQLVDTEQKRKEKIIAYFYYIFILFFLSLFFSF